MEKAGWCSLGPPPGNTSCPASSASVTGGKPTPAGASREEQGTLGFMFQGLIVAEVQHRDPPHNIHVEPCG